MIEGIIFFMLAWGAAAILARLLGIFLLWLYVRHDDDRKIMP